MRIIRQAHHIKPSDQGAIATIGNFDGCHLGHQQLLKRIRDLAVIHRKPSMVILFEPSPHEFFCRDAAPPRLSNLREKIQFLQQKNIDAVFVLRFNQRLALQRADSFIDDLLIEQLRISHLVVGEDFQFGHQRQGNIGLLQQAATRQAFELDVLSDHLADNQRISSTIIRQCLQAGDLTTAKNLIGRDYSMSGRVIHGTKRGRLFGIPTANIAPKRHQCAMSGIFFVRVDGPHQNMLGVAHLGTQPAVGGKREMLEVHLLDYAGNLYGQFLRVNFLKKHRDTANFSSEETLITAMNQDIHAAKQYFSTLKIG